MSYIWMSLNKSLDCQHIKFQQALIFNYVLFRFHGKGHVIESYLNLKNNFTTRFGILKLLFADFSYTNIINIQ